MNYKPIIFSDPMVRALLDGRKTQTRRIVKPQPECRIDEDRSVHCANCGYGMKLTRDGATGIHCPYGKPGDRLWVREGTIVHASIREQLIGYTADGCYVSVAFEKRMPSIYMRRAHARITLEITEVRVQRLQEISEEDARTEGFGSAFGPGCFSRAFDSYWDEINGAGTWALNPWVWVLTFKRIEKISNINRMQKRMEMVSE